MQNKYIILDENKIELCTNIIYKGEKASKIDSLTKLKQLYPNAKVYKLKEIKI